MTTLHGAWIWYELMTPDAAGAKAFYEGVLGWTIHPGTEPPLFYGEIATADGGHTGGVLPLSEATIAGGCAPGWVGYVGVDDIDATLTQLQALGGRLLMPKTTLPAIGSFAMVADPDGAPFYLMTPEMPAGAPPSTAFSPHLPGRCGWNELRAGDVDRALAFYTTLFGWVSPGAMDMGPMGAYHFVNHGDTPIGAIMQRPDDGTPPHWKAYFRVPAMAAAVDTIAAHGGEVLFGPQAVPTGDQIIQARDPQGLGFSLVGRP